MIRKDRQRGQFGENNKYNYDNSRGWPLPSLYVCVMLLFFPFYRLKH